MSAPRPRGLLPAALADRPLWYLSCGFFAGAAAAAGDATAAGVALIFQWAPLSRRRARLTVAAVAVVLLAILAGAAAAAGVLAGLQRAPAALAAARAGGPVEGWVRAVERDARGLRLLLQVPRVPGTVAAVWPTGPGDPRDWPLPGDRVAVLTAREPEAPRAARNPFAFDARRYWYARQVGVLVEARSVTVVPGRWSPQRALARWRHERLARLYRVLSPEPAGLLAALLFGERAGLDAGIDDAFRRAGISHLLTVSGLHVGLVAATVHRLALRLGAGGPARWGGVATAAALYAVLAGSRPPVHRAAVGAALLAAAPLLSRPADPLNLLGAAACWALWARPLAALDLSLRLSFLAVAGMLLLAGRLRALLPRAAGPEGVWHGLAVGFAAQWALAPVLAASFGEVAWLGGPATLAALPPLALLLGAGGAWVLADAACPACAALLTPSLEGLAWLAARMGQVLALPGAVWDAPSPPGWWVLLYYLLLCGWAADWRSAAERLRRREVGVPRRLGIAGAGLAVLLLVGTAALVPRHLEIVFLDVGQGDAIAIGAPGGAWATVDTGRTGRELVSFLRARGVRRLAWAAVTHAHADHAGGLDALARIDPRAPRIAAGDDDAGGAGTGAAPARIVARGDGLALGPVAVTVLGPPRDLPARWSVNDRSLVLRVDWRGRRVLLTGDVEAAAEQALLAPRSPGELDLAAEVLKVAHHGSDTSTSAAWLAVVRPRLAVISVGRGNAYGHPHEPVLQRLAAAGATVLRTDRHGAVWLRVRPEALDITYYGPEGPRRFRLPRRRTGTPPGWTGGTRTRTGRGEGEQYGLHRGPSASGTGRTRSALPGLRA